MGILIFHHGHGGHHGSHNCNHNKDKINYDFETLIPIKIDECKINNNHQSNISQGIIDFNNYKYLRNFFTHII